MANEQAQPTQNQYAIAREVRKARGFNPPQAGDQTDKSSMQPDKLLNEQNRFDPITHTPRQVGSMTGKTGERNILDRA